MIPTNPIPMIRKSRHGKTTLAAFGLTMAGLLSVAVSPAHADLLAYEGFDYTPTETLQAKRGGTGWALNWSTDGSNAVNGKIRAASLNGNQSIATHGHCVTVGTGAIYARALASTLGTTGTATTRWVSMFYSAGTAATLEQRIGFYAGLTDGAVAPNPDGNTNTAGASQVINVGRTSQDPNDTICLYPVNSSTTFSSTGISTPRDTVAAFLLLRFDLGGDTAPDTVSLWVNPIPGAGEASLGPAQATWTTSNLDAINGFRFQAATGMSYFVDEIGIGTTFADVTPAAPTQSGQITRIVPSTSDVNLVWDSFGDGQNYSILTSPNLEPGSWTLIEGYGITNGNLTVTVPNPSEEKAFFKVTSP